MSSKLPAVPGTSRTATLPPIDPNSARASDPNSARASDPDSARARSREGVVGGRDGWAHLVSRVVMIAAVLTLFVLFRGSDWL